MPPENRPVDHIRTFQKEKKEIFLDELKKLKTEIQDSPRNFFLLKFFSALGDKVNFLIRDGVENLDHLRDESLYLLYRLKDVNIDCTEAHDSQIRKKCSLKSLAINKNIKERMLPLETNILRKDYIKRYLSTHTPCPLPPPKFTLEVKVYDSVKRTLLQVLRLRNDNTLSDLADAILCNVCKLEGLKYQRFFFLEKEIYREVNTKLGLIDMSGDIIEKFNGDSGVNCKIFWELAFAFFLGRIKFWLGICGIL